MKAIIKSISLLLALICIISLCSCQNEKSTDNELNQKESESASEGKGNSNSQSESSSTTSKPSSSTSSSSNAILSADLASYKIVVGESASSSVSYSANSILIAAKKFWGVKGDLSTDNYAKPDEQDFEVLVGNTNRPESKSFISKLKKGEGGWAVIGSKLVIAGYSDSETVTATGRFYSSVMSVLTTAGKVYINDNRNKTEKMSDMISIMSFNIYVGNQSPQNTLNIIHAYNPDIFGVQEASTAWKSRLKLAFQDEYEIIGLGRENNKSGESTQIFIRKGKFNIVSSGTKWLTDTPDTPSRTGGALYNRIATYAVLETANGKTFNYVNTHLDHATDDNVRINQINYLQQILDSNTDTKLPTFITGDFNFTSGNSGFSKMTALGYKPSYELAGIKASSATFGNSTIDFCFVSNYTKTETLFYRVATETKFGEGSDHKAVYTLFRY